MTPMIVGILLAILAIVGGADALGDMIQAGGSNKTAAAGSTGDALAIVPAGKGVKAVVTTPTSGASAAGKLRVVVSAIGL